MPDRPDIPLNALRTFEVAARQGSFTRAAIELRVTQAAVSHQIARLEDILGVILFHRTSAGLVMTDAGQSLFPVMERGLDDIARMLDRVAGGQPAEVLNIGVVTTFAAGWLIPRLEEFAKTHPGITLRLSTNNNRVEIAREGLDAAIRFGTGKWPGTEAHHIMDAPMSPLCAPAVDLRCPADLRRLRLFRSYRADEWPAWFAQTGETCPPLTGPVLDSSVAMADLAAEGFGVALLPVPMFERHLLSGRLKRPLSATVTLGGYWLTIPRDRRMTSALTMLLEWMRGA
ncbi:LysR family transcriptional regulator [Pseudodonghicola xiamenensis]|uniref:LysR family transcriptional regulator n=1 Tax=Pseudodonghicola xiamenensis TaxID=337702 RepID=A0A8J3MG45_9RHOB|nr:LysR family transcriptional regulator [Pseudodonghicola xiamenensis]GHG98772.1 LysR family transcriptional regulator [Pseudodonghicola xiamenensis]